MGLLLEGLPAAGVGLQAGSPQNPQPELALVGFLRDDSELETRAAECNLGTRLGELAATDVLASMNWPTSSNLLSRNLQCRIFPALLCEVPDPSTVHNDPFSEQRARLANKSRPYPPNLPPAEMTRWQGTDESLRRAHDVADGAMGARTAGGGCNVTVGRDPPMRNAADDGADAGSKISTFAPLVD